MTVEEVLRTNDPVRLSWARAVLAEAGIDSMVFDAATSAVEGSIGAIPRRLVVPAERASYARWLLDRAQRELEADEGSGCERNGPG